MNKKPRFFNDIAGMAGGAFSVFAGVREEVTTLVRNRVDEVIASLDLVRRSEFDIVREMASRARKAQEETNARIADLEARLATVEQRSHPPAENM